MSALQHRRRRWLLVGVAAAVVVGAAALPARGAESIRVGVIGLIADAGIFVAHEKGYFREVGLDVKLEPFSSSVRMLPALTTGDLEVATGGIAASLFNGAAQGQPMLVVADKGSTSAGMGTNVLLIAKGAWDRHHGPRLGRPGRLHIHRAHGDVWRAEGGRGQASRMAQGAVQSPGGVLFYHVDFARKRSEAARQFMVGYVRGVRFYHDALREGGQKREELIRILILHTNAKERDVYDEVTWAGLNPDGAALTQSIADQQQFFVKMGRVEKPVPIEKLVDNTFAENAVKLLGPSRR